mmetsp:Transcript_134347/g.388891  ORF Transcript_134347/g.388891 Transcript_134347/m.388891 type:complete len:314 (-) Transcript_134347:24-965(-)
MARRNSIRNTSSKPMAAPRAIASKLSFKLVGDLDRNVPRVSAAQLHPDLDRRSRASKTAATLDALAKHSSKASAFASNTDLDRSGSEVCAAKIAATSTEPPATAAARNALSKSSTASLTTKWVARPVQIMSAAPSRAPVKAMYRPAPGKGTRGSHQFAPTSGKKPMEPSGIAKEARSVTTRNWPLTARPAPQPMAMPSTRATWGIGLFRILCMSEYSARNCTSGPSPPARASKQQPLTSPPAENALAEALFTKTMPMAAPGADHASKCRSTQRHMSAVNAFKAAGLFSMIVPTPPSTVPRTSASAVCAIALPA